MHKLTHRELSNLGNDLGYSLGSEGLCQGFSLMLCQAWLAHDEQTFFKRLDFIATYKSDGKDLTEKDCQRLKKDIDAARQRAKEKSFDLLDEETKLLLEIPAFYEGVMIYLHPDRSDLFINPINQQDIKAIYSFVRPKQLEQKELAIVLDKSYACNKTSLIEYLSNLRTILKDTDSEDPIILSSAHHTVCLRYNSKTQKWIYSDTNFFRSTKKYFIDLDSSKLAECIFLSFQDEKYAEEYVVFTTTIMTASNQHNQLEENLNAFDKKYSVTSDHVLMHNQRGDTLLFIACRNGHLEIVQKLLKYPNIDVNHTTKMGNTALLNACMNMHLEIVQELLKHPSIDVNRTLPEGLNPLHIACQWQHLAIVQELLKHPNIDVNQPYPAKGIMATPLYIACSTGDLKIVQELLKHPSTDVNRTLPDGSTALYIACKEGHLAIVQELLKHPSTDVNRTLPNGITLLHIACCQRQHLAIVQELLKHPNIDVNQQCPIKGIMVTPLHIACTNNNLDVVKVLLKHPKIKITLENELKIKPLFLPEKKDTNERLSSKLKDFIELAQANPSFATNLWENNKNEVARLVTNDQEWMKLHQANALIACDLFKYYQDKIASLFTSTKSLNELQKIAPSVHETIIKQKNEPRSFGAPPTPATNSNSSVATKPPTRSNSSDAIKPATHTSSTLFVPSKRIKPSSALNISMKILGGFMVVLGCAAIALAFAVLQAATLGTAGLVVAGLGATAVLGGTGLFAINAIKR